MKNMFDCKIEQLPPHTAPKLKAWYTRMVRRGWYHWIVSDMTVKELLLAGEAENIQWVLTPGALGDLLRFIIKYAEIKPKGE